MLQYLKEVQEREVEATMPAADLEVDMRPAKQTLEEDLVSSVFFFGSMSIPPLPTPPPYHTHIHTPLLLFVHLRSDGALAPRAWGCPYRGRFPAFFLHVHTPNPLPPPHASILSARAQMALCSLHSEIVHIEVGASPFSLCPPPHHPHLHLLLQSISLSPDEVVNIYRGRFPALFFTSPPRSPCPHLHLLQSISQRPDGTLSLLQPEVVHIEVGSLPFALHPPPTPPPPPPPPFISSSLSAGDQMALSVL